MKNVQSSVESPSVRNRISSRGIAAIGAAILVASAGSAMAQSAPQPRPATQTASAAGETEIGRKRVVEPVRPVDAAKPANRAPVARPVIAPVAPAPLADTSDDVWNERARAAYAAVDVLDLGLETNASVAARSQTTLGYIDLPVGVQGEFDVAHATNALPQ